MIHDYWQYRPDPEPARAALPGRLTGVFTFNGQS
jgi:hypothetical protein